MEANTRDPVETLGERLGEVCPVTADELQQELERSISQSLVERGEAGAVHPTVASSVMPMLRLTVGAAQAAGHHDLAETLRRHYLHWMPALWLDQVTARRSPFLELFHTPLDWDRLPRLRGALERLFALLTEAGVTEAVVAGADSLEALMERHGTVASLFDATHFGRWMPLLYGYPADLASYHAELLRGDDPMTVIDRRLTAPLLHELLHFRPGRACAFPPYLDECIAGGLGVIVLPSLAWPEPGEDHGLMGASWFAQVGLVMASVVGLPRLVRAQAGCAGWEELLGSPLTRACERLGWARYLEDHGVHFLSGNTRPDAWCRLFYAHAAGVDLDVLDVAAIEALDVEPGAVPPAADELALIEAGLRAMCVETTLMDGSYRVRSVAPPVPLCLEVKTWTLRRERTSPWEPAAPTWLIPPSCIARLQAAGHVAAEIVLRDVAAIPELAVAVAAGLEVERDQARLRWKGAAA